MVSEIDERRVVKELIELYRNLPCLWDMRSEDYRFVKKKNLAWGMLLEKLKEIDPDANIYSVKRKIDNLRNGYKRELKKVRKSLQQSKSEEDVHEPSLWYFKLLDFLSDRKYEISEDSQSDDVYMVIVDDKYQSSSQVKQSQENELEKQKQYYTEELKRSLQKGDLTIRETRSLDTNPFAVYVGKQLDEMTPFQRKVAEKVISEVLFLGKTESLNFDSKVVTPTETPRPEPWVSPNKTSEIKENPPISRLDILNSATKRKISREPIVKKKAKRKISTETKKGKPETAFIDIQLSPESSQCSSQKTLVNPLSTDGSSEESDQEEAFEVDDEETSKYDDDDDSNDDSILKTLLKSK
ncbi:uncharacterized protein LOC135085761 isoform X1 [Ostrinia nubilalis]|uniref:uncharacterized protein LOC135085761 isoform X1 n=1 Tax=Ostrinia nubilalis TaxID=29057 RepID=UPI0030826329